MKEETREPPILKRKEIKQKLDEGQTPAEIMTEGGIDNQQTQEEALKQLKVCYQDIIKVLKNYIDLKEDYYSIVATWIIGTYLHKEFTSYPYLFFNAMKGSGKTRTLKLIEALCWKGKITNNMTEAVLFRTASVSTILIDEFESVGHRDKSTIRELLNSAYKKGAKVERIKKKNTKEGEEMVIESFNLYCPIAMANIWGMSEVLGDRCIQMLLEKSKSYTIPTLIEDFENDEFIVDIKQKMDKFSVAWCTFFRKFAYTIKWNRYITDNLECNTYTYTTHTTLTTLPEEEALFDSIRKTGITGRDLELFFPFFIIIWCMDSVGLLPKMLEIAKKYCHEKKETEYIESRDISLLDMISKKPNNLDYIPINDLTREFKMFFEGETDTEKWLNRSWLGRSLKRLNVIRDKRRIARGVEVNLDTDKAREKLQEFLSDKSNK